MRNNDEFVVVIGILISYQIKNHVVVHVSNELNISNVSVSFLSYSHL